MFPKMRNVKGRRNQNKNLLIKFLSAFPIQCIFHIMFFHIESAPCYAFLFMNFRPKVNQNIKEKITIVESLNILKAQRFDRWQNLT